MLKILQSRNWIHTVCAAWLLCTLAAYCGCGASDSTDTAAAEKKSIEKTSGDKKKKTGRKKKKKKKPTDNKKTSGNKPKPGSKKPKPDIKSPPRILGDFLKEDDDQPAYGSAASQPKLKIDEGRVSANGIRKLTGKHLTLYTDLPAGKDIDELPNVFDLAVPQWCEYFQLDTKKVENWRMTAFIMRDKKRFQKAGLLPEHLPPFLYGFQLGQELWVYEQPSAYYRRHLLLHEGTHAFMAWHLGGSGPPWYSEGMAELLGTHRWKDGRLQLNYFPQDRSETPLWGRVKIVQDDFRNQRGKTLMQIMYYGNQAHLQVEPYGWSWAATAFFDNHPDYRQAFRQQRLQANNATLNFSESFYEKLKDDWPKITEQWQLFIVEMDYGYDVAQAVVAHKPGSPLPAEGTSVTIRADRGWQSTGIHLEQGKAYTITASGRYQVGKDPKPWWCEPGGVTIRYYRGQPLGMLMGAVRDDDWKGGNITPLAFPEPIGLSREINLKRSGTLYLRINEFSGSLADNSGELKVHVVAK